MNPKRFFVLFALIGLLLFGLWLPAGAAPRAQQYVTPTPGTDGRIVYIVQAGDTLTSIAQRFGTDVAVLVAVNGITDVAQIQIGQTLKIPGQRPANVVVSSGDTAGRHVVQRGETLSQIARRYNTTVAELQRLNNLANASLIVAGQVIQLPSGTTGGGTTTGGQQVYVVKRGDTLSQIAERFGVSTTDLARANGITNPRLIFAGQQLVIP